MLGKELLLKVYYRYSICLISILVYSGKARLWEGFLRCIVSLAPASVPIVLQMPAGQVKTVITAYPKLKPLLVSVAYCIANWQRLLVVCPHPPAKVVAESLCAE